MTAVSEANSRLKKMVPEVAIWLPAVTDEVFEIGNDGLIKVDIFRLYFQEKFDFDSKFSSLETWRTYLEISYLGYDPKIRKTFKFVKGLIYCWLKFNRWMVIVSLKLSVENYFFSKTIFWNVWNDKSFVFLDWWRGELFFLFFIFNF